MLEIFSQYEWDFTKQLKIGLYSCQLEKLIACLYVPGKEGKKKIKILLAGCLVVIGTTKEMNATNLAWKIASNFLIQFVYQETFW